MIDLRRLGALRELGRRGSLARTAEALHLTPSAVSQQLAALSRELGVPLIEREGRGVRLTGQAQVVLQHADLIAAQMERARADLAAWNHGRHGSVTIGAFSSAISGLLPAVLRALAETRPDIDIAVVEAEPPDLFTRLDAGQIDVAVAVDFAEAPPYTDRRYTRTGLLTDILDLALPADHRYAHLDRVPLRDLAADPWIVGDARSCCGAVTRSVCAAGGFTPKSGTPSTTGSRLPPSSRPEQGWHSYPGWYSRCIAADWCCARPRDSSPAEISSPRYARAPRTIPCSPRSWTT